MAINDFREQITVSSLTQKKYFFNFRVAFRANPNLNPRNYGKVVSVWLARVNANAGTAGATHLAAVPFTLNDFNVTLTEPDENGQSTGSITLISDTDLNPCSRRFIDHFIE